MAWRPSGETDSWDGPGIRAVVKAVDAINRCWNTSMTGVCSQQAPGSNWRTTSSAMRSIAGTRWFNTFTLAELTRRQHIEW
jgi:hypothetical protein